MYHLSQSDTKFGNNPLLMSAHIIHCFKMVDIENSVQSSGDPNFQSIQKIYIFNYIWVPRQPLKYYCILWYVKKGVQII